MASPFAHQDMIDDDGGETGAAWENSRDERRKLFRKYFDECDYYQKWASQSEAFPEDEAHERTLYLSFSAKPGEASLEVLQQAAGVTLGAEEGERGDPDDHLVVTSVHTKGHDGGKALARTANVHTGMVVASVSGCKVYTQREVEEVLERFAAQDCHPYLPVSFQETVHAKLHHPALSSEQDRGGRKYHFGSPHVACHRSKEQVDLSISALLGFSVSGGLKVFGLEDSGKDSKPSPAAKAKLANGLVVRKIKRGEKWHLVRCKRDFRRYVADTYEEAARAQGLDSEGIPAVTIEIQFTKEPESPGEVAAREFHNLCGELEWKGRSTAAIDMYERLKESCSFVSEAFKEGEDTKMQDFKRYISAFFVRTFLWQQQLEPEAEHVDDARSAKTQTVKSEGTRTSHDLQRIVCMGGTTRHPMTKSLTAAGKRRANPPAPSSQGGGTQGNEPYAARDEMQGAQNFNHGLADMDAYGDIVLKLLKARIAEEVEEVSKARVGIFYCAILQFALGLAVFSVASEDMPSNGGKFAPFIATTAAAAVGVISAILGFIGSMGGGAHVEPGDELKTGDDMPELGEPNETLMQQFMAANCWLLAILTAFLYSEILELDESQLECGGLNPGDVPSGLGLCKEAIKRHATLVGLCGSMLCIVFLGIVFANNLLDSVNDKAKLDSKELFMTYFRVRFFEGKLFMAKHLPHYVAKNYWNRLDNDMIVDPAAQSREPKRRATIGKAQMQTMKRRGSVIVDEQAESAQI
eukprot:TRINITY_DN1878_c0_g1_i2.p1 TRINITY_DN1878_c0_g1~~TRINITY_DN1878_c0_g1_i2.p1  ORF type:complete len:787 (+),score=293.02 TRINITY_DN1878_c0_g1_i2:114-2363(+)